MSKQSSTASPFLSTNALLAMGIIWGFASLLFFLLFSVPPPGQDHPQWYLDGITVFETGAFVLSSLLCLRNWQSGQIVSGRTVWLWIGLGLLCFSFGNLLFYLWGNVWGKDPAVSLGDAFYLLSYIFLATGMFQAVLPRRLNLDMPQWILVAIVGLLGVVLAFFLSYRAGAEVEEAVLEPEVPIQEVEPADGIEQTDPEALRPSATPELELEVLSEAEVEASTAPAWVVSLDTALEPFESFVSLLYVLGDCLLIVVATTLLVAFWGGRFSQSWKLIAIAAICLYIADMCFAYYVSQSDYQEGSLWEVFWTFSAVFFGLGAIVEYAISTRSRRSRRRRAS
ncbi:hypothetical protein PN498_22285 [Oscillatoria sp. CS-180]|uniref:hypothetical protein n=1 Tax=Oscillatoria sp. CS-180 TaxID=3021720 RepID=UPI00232CFDA2|nr:hypothetical protein [Oscillatoria sp. CS-180]MDB9528737.1 hypothetical protein [Oscillatoria sp. CS-180]